jgi:uncharacterized protein YacL
VVLPQGVKINELETSGPKPTNFAEDTQFSKKTSKANMIFLIVGIVLGLIVAGLLIYAFTRTQF